MIIIGLTGSIGMGKSTAAYFLKTMGIDVHDSDKAVHDSLQPKGTAFEEIAVTFPECWDKKKRIIDKKKLGDIVFHDDEALKKLEQILHPIAKKSQMDFIKSQRAIGKKICVLEIPLLFETGADKRVDYVACVTAPYIIQRRRVLQRKGMSDEKFKQILKRQLPNNIKCARSDFVITTGLGRTQTFKDLKKMIQFIKNSRST